MLPEMKYTQKLRLGMPVFATDGKAGKIAKIITDPESRQPVYLAVEIGRLPNRREVVLPVSLVRGVTAETVNLDITRQTLADFPDYE
ncbi:MAG TPA: PRC-barrel domain containing protein, partial [Chloroflexi bacterium]|nr:PRC-barrel domain containing protein [Chloroflexota bacterium]